MEPKETEETQIPDIMLVPLLSFTADCHRLGYGGGFYDRTISNIKRNHRRDLLTIGLAFECQKYQP
jgi:5-formyltetrahydrofolate cyclo-ligase